LNNPKAISIYADGVAKRQKFTDIEKRIKDQTGISNPMYPRNTPYFNVAASDFGMPEIAQLIVDTYGEMRDDDARSSCIASQSFSTRTTLTRSIQTSSNDTATNHTTSRTTVKTASGTAAICRPYRKNRQQQFVLVASKRCHGARKLFAAKCDPGTCDEFGQGQCKFRGRLLFYVPGIPSTGILGMETSSEYAAEGIWSDLERILDALGTIPRWNPNKPGAPIFWITKSLEPRTYFDEHGKKQSGFQWVPKLQADIDIGAVLTSGKAFALPAAQTPVAWLSPPKGMPEAVLLPVTDSAVDQSGVQAESQQGGKSVNDQLEKLIDEMGLDENSVMQYFDIKIAQSWENDEAHVATAIKMLKDLCRLGNRCAAKLIGISVRVSQLGIDPRDFTTYTFARYGKGFTAKEEVLSRIESEIEDLAKLPREQAAAHIKKLDTTAQAA